MKEKTTIRVMIADGHEIYRDGLRLLLKKQTNITLVAEAENGEQALAAAIIAKPHVILMDIKMPVMDGIYATRRLKESHPDVSVIALSMSNEDYLLAEMMEAGAKSFLLKNADKREIIEAINSVYSGTMYYCRNTSAKLAAMLAKSKFNPFDKTVAPSFTNKEIEIIRLICKEYTNEEIADELFLSRRTVEGHRLKILKKLKVKSATGIVGYAIRNKIIDSA
jgi:DNA-binding NarL/FixJ family response regulator